ncbi:MAG: hypothetical protein SOX75_02660 [Candidatus Limivicinus sp.]|nr:hypothetical protein [Candidatus Limivicinus sp.]
MSVYYFAALLRRGWLHGPILCAAKKDEHNYARAGKFLARAAMSSVLDTATLYLQRVMQLIAGGFLYASITASDHGKFI